MLTGTLTRSLLLLRHTAHNFKPSFHVTISPCLKPANAGTGPTFLETAYQPPTENPDPEKQSTDKPPESSERKLKRPRHKKKKIRTDFWE